MVLVPPCHVSVFLRFFLTKIPRAPPGLVVSPYLQESNKPGYRKSSTQDPAEESFQSYILILVVAHEWASPTPKSAETAVGGPVSRSIGRNACDLQRLDFLTT